MGISHIRVARPQLATVFDFTVAAPPNRAAHARTVLLHAQACLRQLEKELAETEPQSPVARLNAGALHDALPVPTSIIDLLGESARMEALSGGAFEFPPAFGWDRDQGLAWRRGEGKLRLHTLAKGYALDLVRTMLLQEGFYDFCLSAGGQTLVLSGFSALSTAWCWSLPAQAEETPVTLEHQTGQTLSIGLQGRPSAVAIVALESAVQATALSLALYNGGWDTSHRLSVNAHAPALAFLQNDSPPRWNSRFQELWGPLPVPSLASPPAPQSVVLPTA